MSAESFDRLVETSSSFLVIKFNVGFILYQLSLKVS